MKEMLHNCYKHKYDMSIQISLLHSYLDWFLKNFGDLSEEQEERFHYDEKSMGGKYQGRCNPHEIVD